MKIIKKYIACAAIAFVSTACTKSLMITDINEDGTCHREFIIKADSLTVVPHSYENGQHNISLNDDASFRPDSTWKISCIANATGKRYDYPLTPEIYAEIKAQNAAVDSVRDEANRAVSIVYSHDFNTAEEMSKAFPYFIKNDRVEVESKLEKSYKWLIFTDYTYTENYRSVLSKFSIGIENYMTLDEANIWCSGTTETTDKNGNAMTTNHFEGMNGSEIKSELDQIETKVSQWVCANYAYDLCTYLEEHHDEIKDAPISAKEFAEKKMDIVNIAVSANGDIDDNFFTSVISKIVNPEPYIKFIEDQGIDSSDAFAVLGNHTFNYISEINIEASLSMPGTLRSISNGTVKDGKVKYLITGERFVPSDYVIVATSRTINWWIIILVATVAIASTIGVRIAKRNDNLPSSNR